MKIFQAPVVKSLCFKMFIRILILSVLVVGIFFYTVPYGDIKGLKNHYFWIEIQKDKKDIREDKIIYHFVKKRPANWVSLKQVSPSVYRAIMLSEDWGFYKHHGIDTDQIKEAIVEKVIEGKNLRGASTITQQVAKNVFLSNERSLWRKFREMIIAFFLEKELSKKQILEVYLNAIEYGPRVYGIKHASEYYFHTSPSNLGPREGAFLAMLLPNPKKYSQSYRRGELTRFARRIVNSVLSKMVMAGYMSAENAQMEMNRTFAWEKAGAAVENPSMEDIKSNANASYEDDDSESESDNTPSASATEGSQQ